MGCPRVCERFQRTIKQWVGNAHGYQSLRCLWEKRVGRFETRGGRDLQLNREATGTLVVWLPVYECLQGQQCSFRFYRGIRTLVVAETVPMVCINMSLQKWLGSRVTYVT